MSEIDVLEVLSSTFAPMALLFAVLAAIEAGVRLALRSTEEPDRD